MTWGPLNVTTGASANTQLPTLTPAPPYANYYGGFLNQQQIINHFNINDYPAFNACAQYNGGGYTDWFLPSPVELNQIAQYLPVFLDEYWSSTENDANTALKFGLGFIFRDEVSVGGTEKNIPYGVIAVRAF